MRSSPGVTAYELLPKGYSADGASYDDEAVTSVRSIRESSSWSQRFSGWRGGVAACIAISALVLFLNAVLAIVAAVRWDKADGLAAAFTGDCGVAARWTTAIHLVINLLSSLLLGASNYCMQRLVAPTRQEIDDAHAQKRWLDIGIPSIRNVSSINARRVVIWTLLALSSVPLHFLYNSVMFQTIGTNAVYFLVVTPEFFTVKNSWHHEAHDLYDDPIPGLQETLLHGQYLNRTAFENITGTECVSRYNAQFISSGSAFAVPMPGTLSGPPRNNSLVASTFGIGQFIDGVWPNKYSYCLVARKAPRVCNVHLSPAILGIVIACNVVKVGLMVCILYLLNQETIVTIGDAIKSFLQKPDATTSNSCLMSRKTVSQLLRVPEAQHGRPFQQKRRERWGVACSKRRWAASLFLYFGALTATATLMALVSAKWKSWKFDGFGKVSVDSVIDMNVPFGQNSIPYVLLANLPQGIVSFLYLLYNGQFTAMLAQREWSNYAIKRAPLRVTKPSPGQRSTYFLQLPYTFGVPLLLAAVLLHWLISQSIFLVRIIPYEDGKPSDLKLSTMKQVGGSSAALGWSNAGLVVSFIWGCVLVAVILLVAFFGRYPIGLPIGGTNSAVISAACHGEERERRAGDIADRPVKWGVTRPGSRDAVGHCCFSGEEVGKPEVGSLYAGYGLR